MLPASWALPAPLGMARAPCSPGEPRLRPQETQGHGSCWVTMGWRFGLSPELLLLLIHPDHMKICGLMPRKARGLLPAMP